MQTCIATPAQMEDNGEVLSGLSEVDPDFWTVQ
jgi:hypothetical protein